jgi:putative copper resistance protein D
MTDPLTLERALGTWQFTPVVSGLLAVLAAGYLAGVRRVRRRHPARPWPVPRSLAFLAGLAVIAVATESSVGVYDQVFSVHMVQHLLLIMVAPPLLVAGRPVTLLLHASRNPLHTWVKRLLRSRAVTALTWPPFTVVFYAAVVAGTHLTPFRNLVLDNQALHDAEHALYLLAGYLYFLPVIGSEPIRWRVPVFGRYLLLLTTMPVEMGVAAALLLMGGDLPRGGLVMLAGSDLIMVGLGAALAVGLVRQPARQPARRAPGQASAAAGLDAYNAHLRSLDPGR